MKWGVFGLGLFGAAMCLAANASGAAGIHAYDRAPQGTTDGSRHSPQPADPTNMDRQRAYNAPDDGSVPQNERAQPGARAEPQAGWAGDTAPNPDDDDPNPVYPI